jgi:hypothetical protein
MLRRVANGRNGEVLGISAMTMDELRDELLTPPGMVFFRQTIADHYVWLTHEAPFECIDNTIRKDGIQPRKPARAVPSLVTDRIPNYQSIVCLNPNKSQPAGSSHVGHVFRMGVRASDLPARVGLDWSYPDNWDMRHISAQQIHDFGKDGAILYVMDQTGSVASYDPIPASALRVCTRGKHGLYPSTWPLLSSVGNEDVMTFDRRSPHDR